jgi:hypothetical protein
MNTDLIGTIPGSIFNSSALYHVSFVNNGLVGTIPGSLYSIESLSYLHFQENGISGEISNDIGKLERLQTLFISCSSMAGSFPRTLFKLPLISSISIIGSPGIYGSIPDEIASLQNLRSLTLNGLSSLSGTLPPSFKNLASLIDLDLSNTGIGGRIDVLTELTLLAGLYLGHTQFSGPIPASIGRLTRLVDLNLGNTGLEGPIPPEIGRLKLLVILEMGGTSGRGLGQLPPEIGLLTSMSKFQLSNTGLNGTIPPEVINMRNLTMFMLSSNDLRGPIPKFHPNVPSSFSILLSNNRLTGGLENLVSLEGLGSGAAFVSASSNKLSGTVPIEVIRRFPGGIDFRFNQLSGELPKDAFVTTGYEFRLDHNNLQGFIPTEGLESNTKLGFLSLANNNFSGTLSPQFAKAPRLGYIDVSNNRLTGGIEGWNEAKPQGPLEIHASGNLFSGQIGFINHSLVNLIDLSNNDFTGTVPVLPPELLSLDLSNNKLWGGLDNLLGPRGPDFASLQTINLSNNRLNGSIPYHLLNMTTLTSLNLAHNMLTGRIDQFATSSPLALLDLSFNSLSGALSSDLSFPRLGSLKLNDNKLQGSIVFGRFPQLSYLDISNNAFKNNVNDFSMSTDLATILARTIRFMETPATCYCFRDSERWI